MNLKDCPVPVYGDTSYRGDCPIEDVELASVFSWLKKHYPDTWGVIAYHPRNEGLLVGRQFSSVIKKKAEGLNKGASDVIVPGSPSFVCELKRRDHKKSKWEDGQIPYLETAQKMGAFACVALGAHAAVEAFEEYLFRHHQGNK